MIKQRKIPTFLGLLILVIGMAAGFYLTQRGSSLFLRAKTTATPKQVKITNITESGFTVSWITEGKTTGFVQYGPAPAVDLTAADDRDQISGKTTAFTTHHVSLRGLKPATTYYFKIGSGDKLYDNNGQPYQVATAPTMTSPPPASDLAHGLVTQPDGSPAAGAIVYLSLANTTPLSALTKSSGSWVIPLHNARTSDLQNYTTYDRQASIEEIFVQGGEMGTATAIVTTKNDAPVPKIALGQSYDFRQSGEGEKPASPPPSSQFSLQPIASPPPQAAPVEGVVIINPAPAEKVSTTKPEIIGQGPAGQKIEILLHSLAHYSDEVEVGPDGYWRWTPPAELEPGEHTLTVSYLDNQGQKRSLSRSFVVLAAGSVPAFEATPSATTLTPTPTVTTPTPTATPSLQPASRTSLPSTEGGVPTSGNWTPTFLLFIIGISLVLFGGWWLFN